MNKTLNSALTEQANNNNGQKLAKAKEIFLGIDTHLKSNQVARKIDNSATRASSAVGFTAMCKVTGR